MGAWTWGKLAVSGFVLMLSSRATAFTANKVWFEFRPDGRFRVHVSYTIPELRELRESWVDFAQRKAAERYYWDLVRGVEFFPPDPTQRAFKEPKQAPEPW